MRRLPHALAALCIAALSACADGGGGDAASTDSLDAAASPDSSASPPDTGPAAPAEPVALAATGLGAASFGATPTQFVAALGDAVGAPEGDGGCHTVLVRGMPGVRLMVVSDRVVRADVDSAGTATDRGVRVGDDEARVRELHGAVRSMPHKYTNGKYLVALPGAPEDTLHRLVFETDSAGTVTTMRGGLHPQVEWVEGCS